MPSELYAVEDPADLAAEEAAFELFPRLKAAANAVLKAEYASGLADLLGNPGDFHRYLRGNAGDLAERRAKLFSTFRHNMELLVSKTWVEDHDGKRKDKALDAIDGILDAMGAGDFRRSLALFVKLAEGMATLLFGESPADEGFMDYVFRIDPKLGLFYWYVSMLKAEPPEDEELAQLELLIGIYALSCF